jgi:defect-in-organelle-trafficking protein DotD
MTDYRLKVLGTEPAIPVLVSITARRGVIAEILQNAAFQAQKRAHVMVFPESRVIELRYMPA